MRERGNDIPTLARHFVDRFCRDVNKKVLTLSQSALDELSAYPWPGNVRELQNCIERSVILCEGDAILPHHLSLTFKAPAEASADDPWEAIDLAGTMADAVRRVTAEVERRKVQRALKDAAGNKQHAADSLQISAKALADCLRQSRQAGTKRRLGLAAYLALVWWLRRVHSLLSFGLLWFLLLLIPSSLFFTLGFGEPMAEHRAYGAAVGLFLAWGCSFEILWNRVVERGFVRVLATGAAVLFLAQLGFKTVVRNAVWDDPVGLSSEAVRYAPEHWMPRMLLAEAYRQAGSCVEAVPEYRAAISLRPEEQFPYTKLAGCLIEAGRFEEAEEALLGLRAVNPLSEDASMGLGVFAVLRRSPDESRHYFLETLERDPGHQQARQLLAFVDGTLSEPERVQVCREMEVITQGTFVFDECVARGDTTRDRAERSER